MPRPRSAPTLFAALAALSAPAFASELPQSPTIILPDDGRARAVGDVNGDGAPDVLVTADSGPTSVAFLMALNDGQGGFTGLVETTDPLAESTAIRLTDLTGDGRADVLVYGAGSPLTLLPSTGAGTLGAAVAIPGGESPVSVAFGDVDGDGIGDAVSVSGAAEFRVHRGLGGITFAPAVAVPTDGTGAFDVGLTDVNADGLLDVAVRLSCGGSPSCTTFMLHVAQPGGAYAAPVAVSDETADGAPHPLFGADLDGDGFGDLVLRTVEGWFIAWADGQGGLGTPEFAVDSDFQFGPDQLADVDRDGHLDIHAQDATASILRDEWAVLTQTTPRTFEEIGRTRVREGETLLAADMDRDGASDRVVSWSIFPSVPGGLATLLGDGRGALRNAWQTELVYRPIVADVNQDGLQDLFNVANLEVALGQPNGAPQPFVPLNADGPVSWARLADMDGDGETDLVTSLRPGISAKAVPLNVNRRTGALAFQDAATPELLGPDERQLGLQLGDMDGDGDLDAVRYGLEGNTHNLLRTVLNDGTGQLSDAFATFDGPVFGLNALELGDLDNDGNLDVVLQNGSMRGSFGLGGGTLSVPAMLVPDLSFQGLGDTVLADTNADGVLDLHSSTLGAGLQTFLVRHPGVGDGTFGDAQITDALAETLGFPTGLVAADVDADGDVDVVSFGAGLEIFENLFGTGAFAPKLITNFEGNPNLGERGAVGDVNNDGAPDVVFNDEMGLTSFGVGPWQPLGESLAGPIGFSRLSGGGPLTPGSLAAWHVEFAPPATAGLLVLGLSDLSAPFKGGTLVPFPDVLTPVTTDAQGELTILADWPAGGLPSGFQLWSQVWFVGATPSATTALVATVP